MLYSDPGRTSSRSLTPMTQYTLCSRQAATRRATCGPETSTLDSHIRSHSSSQPPNAGADRAHAFDGYSDTNTSGSTARRAPRPAASASSATAFSTVASASRMTGVAWIAATRTVPKAGMGRA